MGLMPVSVRSKFRILHMFSSSLSRYVYYVSFIDDFSHTTWIYFLKGKNEVFSKFKEYKSLVENQTDRKINTLRSNNGREFTSEEFKELYRESEIKRGLSTPYNPQQNGVVEQTIMEATQPMLHDQDLPMHLWVKETRKTVYVQNRTPHRILDNKTLE